MWSPLPPQFPLPPPLRHCGEARQSHSRARSDFCVVRITVILQIREFLTTEAVYICKALLRIRPLFPSPLHLWGKKKEEDSFMGVGKKVLSQLVAGLCFRHLDLSYCDPFHSRGDTQTISDTDSRQHPSL
ncbi:unnamed protein product [Eretmochelys imbricata]